MRLLVFLTCLIWGTCSLAGDSLAGDSFASDNLLNNSGDMRQRLAACSSCHEYAGDSQQSYAPSIAGKPLEYLNQQLLNYREGRRLNSVMNTLLAYLGDDYLYEIAGYYSTLPVTDVPRNSSAVKQSSAEAIRGKTLVHSGITGPACSACHGNDLRGDGVAIPSLRGLSAKYIAAQLGAWRTNTRRARAPDCMKEVANMLTNDELSAVAQWIAHSFEEAATPQPNNVETPLPCGAHK